MPNADLLYVGRMQDLTHESIAVHVRPSQPSPSGCPRPLLLPYGGKSSQEGTAKYCTLMKRAVMYRNVA
jgi:hypothetical protein